MSMKESGIDTKELIREEDIIESGNFTGYHKNIWIKDYVLITGDTTKQSNLVKEITVEISYKLAGENKIVKISTYISHLWWASERSKYER